MNPNFQAFISPQALRRAARTDFIPNSVGVPFVPVSVAGTSRNVAIACCLHDPATQALTQENLNGTVNFSYNTRGEVVASINNQNSILNRAFGYDPIGNRLTTTEGAGATVIFKTYASNFLNQYTQIQATPPVPPSTNSPIYDDDGNMLTDGTGKVYTWDCENRLIQVSLPNNESVKYYYDAQSRRVKREHIAAGAAETTTYLYDGWNVIDERNFNSSLAVLDSKNYIWGLDLSNSIQGAGGVGGLLAMIEHKMVSSICFYTYDANGNTSELIADTSSVLAHYEYDVFGKESLVVGGTNIDNHFRFSTKYFDSLIQSNYYGYRFFCPSSGNWINRDPIGERGGLHIYQFLRNNTINSWDILGLDWDFGGLPNPGPIPWPMPPELGVPSSCKMEICCKPVTPLTRAHCSIRFTGPNDETFLCRGGPTGTGNSSGSSGSGGGNR